MAPEANEIHRALGRLEGKMDSMLATFAEATVVSAARHKEYHDRHEEHDARIREVETKHDERIRKVENKLNWYAGAGVVVGFVATQFIGQIKRLFGL